MSTVVRACILSFGVLSLSACSHFSSNTLSANVGYIKMSKDIDKPKSISKMRYKVLQHTASSLGAQGALAWRSVHINKVLNSNETNLNHIFNFNLLLLPHNVLPPVAVEASNLLHIADSHTIRYTNKIYQILKPARFVTTPPTWRNYLLMNFKRPELPNKTLLPKTKTEAIVWNNYLKKGWGAGLTQANNIFTTNISRLKRDYQGMMLYRKLLSKSMVVSPVVSQANLGITGDQNELHIHDVVMRITRDAGMQTDIHAWTPYLTAPKNTPNASFR